MPRAGAVLAALITLAAMLTSCRTQVPYQQALPTSFGARVTDGQLRIWTGSPCTQVERVSVDFDPGNERLVLEPPADRWANVEYLTLGGPYPGLEIVDSLPADFDWRAAEELRFSVYGARETGGAGRASIADIADGSADHPADTFWFDGVGWLDPAAVADRDSKDFLATCTPDPDRTPELPVAFGARATDGRLEIWTGATCTKVNGVTLIFQPDADQPANVSLTLGTAGDGSTEFERLTLGGPYPGMDVITPLPPGFDWRSQQTLLLSVHSLNSHHEAQTELAEVIDGSAAHPEDSYWFQGLGWLDPGQVGDQLWTTFSATCTPK